MKQSTSYLGKVALLLFMCVGLVATSSTVASANTKPGTKKTAAAKVAKPKAADTSKKPRKRSMKKKRRNARRSPANSTKKSAGNN